MKIENWNFDITSGYYSNVLKQATQYGIDCKVYGAICAISEIKNAVPLVHCPEGCVYYPRFFPTDAILELDRREKPELIGVIGSCVPAIIGDDLEEHLKPET